MKTIVIALACLLSVPCPVSAQQKAAATAAPALEANVRKLWADYKSKNKEALGAELADEFRQMEEGNSGFVDKKAEVASVDEFDLLSFTLKDFTVKPLGPHHALVTYTADYEGKADGQVSKGHTIFGEVWVREGNDWKALYIQETTVK
jgi:hypothetical protein